jgi:transcriptional regulator with XRE-family HTH domain
MAFVLSIELRDVTHSVPLQAWGKCTLRDRQLIAENIRRLIEKKIKHGEFSSIENFAISTGIQKSLLSRILNLKADPRLSSLDKIATALEVPVSELVRSRK